MTKIENKNEIDESAGTIPENGPAAASEETAPAAGPEAGTGVAPPETAAVPVEDLRHVSVILMEMEQLIKDEIQDKQNMLLMSHDYENLGTAIGMIAGHVPGSGTGLAVSVRETRTGLRRAYAHVDAVKANTVDGSVTQVACFQLQAALFTALNTYYTNGKIQQAVEQVMSAASFGLDAVSGLIDAGPESLAPDYLAESGQQFTQERMELIRDTFAGLLPHQDPESDPGETDEAPGEPDGNIRDPDRPAETKPEAVPETRPETEDVTA